jgi:thymidylate synthase
MVFHIQGRGFPDTWERAVNVTYNHGIDIQTEYDQPGDPLSKDCTMIMDVDFPLLEPRIHGFFPGGPADLQEYRMEVIDGVKDHWVGPAPLWSYTYHQRIAEQMENIIEQLKTSGITRRAQAVTWRVPKDNKSIDPPCLQRVWCRIINHALHMHTHWRSRDGLKAAFMNGDAFITWGEKIAGELGVPFVKYVDMSDSFHIYGKDIEEYKNRFLPMKNKRFHASEWKEMMQEAIPEIKRKIEKRDELNKL